MRRLVHLSDLHFGRDRPELLEPLIAAVNDLAPDAIAISGDLTQRARRRQFAAARAFVQRLEAPCLIVPGNHDVPLDRPVSRLLRPWRRYREAFGRDLEPVWSDDEMTLVGVNSVNPFVWQRGWVARRALSRVRRVLARTPPDRARVIVMHHPLEHLPDERKALTRGAERAVDALAAAGADVVLSGHLHSWRAEPFAHREGRAGLVQVQAGTGLSNRLRGEENDFNLLSFSPDELIVDRYVAPEGAAVFRPAARARFRSGVGGWALHSQPPAA
ncbi:metallophosphoesterase family protein [Amaricoccus solimangrovi]|uniref:Metallophosphoesterase n=1 Tax=Amaricoccus solimangrovi TaxID=2589815 RepID=A0A501WTY9_9RHOB|nr:metallophosphoesterase [Amaricoccus solimangrovi]TPE50431.1 metallophosphoesterase [Amaricoccus solimangrovi]